MSSDGNLDKEFCDLIAKLGPLLLEHLSRDEKLNAVTNPDETRRSVERALRLQKKSATVHPNLRG